MQDGLTVFTYYYCATYWNALWNAPTADRGWRRLGSAEIFQSERYLPVSVYIGAYKEKVLYGS